MSDVDINGILALAKLDPPPPNELARYQADCLAMINMATIVQDLKDTEPLPAARSFVDLPPLRLDIPGPSLPREEAASGAPDFKDGFFLVPKVKD